MDEEKIYNAFPKVLRNDVQIVISVLPLHKNMSLNYAGIDQEILLDGERLSIPKRIYFDEPDAFDRLNELQKTILNCIYSRHHNGYIRQKRLNSLPAKNHYFIVPYVFELLGEYIIEIINDIDSYIDKTNIHLFRKFISENEDYSALIKNKMTSYWNEYYRFGDNRNFKEYVGTRIFDRLEKS